MHDPNDLIERVFFPLYNRKVKITSQMKINIAAGVRSSRYNYGSLSCE